MAARKERVNLNENWREKIQTSMLINRLQDHIDGKIELTPAQIKSIEILLARTAPVLTATELTTISDDEKLTDDQLLAQLMQLIEAHPDLVQQALAAKARKESLRTAPQSTVPVNP